MNMKTDTFGRFVGFGDSIQRTRDGITYRVRVELDIHASIDDDDVHPILRPDDVSDETWEKIQAARAAWFRNEWHYVGLVVSAERDGWERDHVASLWGLEANYPGTDNEYLNDVAAELIKEAEDALSLEAGMGEPEPEHDGPRVGFSADAWDTLAHTLRSLQGYNAETTPVEGEPFPAKLGVPSVAEGPQGYETWGIWLIPLDRDGYDPSGPRAWHAFETLRSIDIY